jgi:hypothetical protein
MDGELTASSRVAVVALGTFRIARAHRASWVVVFA